MQLQFSAATAHPAYKILHININFTTWVPVQVSDCAGLHAHAAVCGNLCLAASVRVCVWSVAILLLCMVTQFQGCG